MAPISVDKMPSGVPPALALVYHTAVPLLPPSCSLAFFYGLTGGVARRQDDVATLADLKALLVPGLAALGVRVDLTLQGAASSAPTRALLAGKGVTLVFAVDSGEEEIRLAPLLSTEENGNGEDNPDGEPRLPFDGSECVTPFPVSAANALGKGAGGLGNNDGKITRMGVVVAVEAGQVVWRGAIGEEQKATLEEMSALFTHALTLRLARRKGQRRANLQAALRRWIAFAAAYPDRTLTPEPEDTPIRALAAEFLREIIGKQRDPVAIRLRRAAEQFAVADMETALHHLREAVFLDLRLPALVQSALLSPPDRPLSDVERRELVYLARAGTRDMKVLAARRLAPERQHAEVRSTLEQLAYDPDAWVRAAASSPAGSDENTSP